MFSKLSDDELNEKVTEALCARSREEQAFYAVLLVLKLQHKGLKRLNQLNFQQVIGGLFRSSRSHVENTKTEFPLEVVLRANMIVNSVCMETAAFQNYLAGAFKKIDSPVKNHGVNIVNESQDPDVDLDFIEKTVHQTHNKVIQYLPFSEPLTLRIVDDPSKHGELISENLMEISTSTPLNLLEGIYAHECKHRGLKSDMLKLDAGQMTLGTDEALLTLTFALNGITTKLTRSEDYRYNFWYANLAVEVACEEFAAGICESPDYKDRHVLPRQSITGGLSQGSFFQDAVRHPQRFLSHLEYAQKNIKSILNAFIMSKKVPFRQGMHFKI